MRAIVIHKKTWAYEYSRCGSVCKILLFGKSLYERAGNVRQWFGGALDFRVRGKALLAWTKVTSFVRKTTQCRRGMHWRMKYDSGTANDICSSGTCGDCGYRREEVEWPEMLPVKPAKSER